MNIITWEDRYPDVLVLGESAPQHARINGHRTSYLPPEHVTTVRGIPVTTAERTLLDLAGVLPERRLRRAIRQAQYLKLTTLGSLVAILRGPGPTRGRKEFARVLATGAAPTQSELEDAVLDLILRGGFAHPLVNAPLILAGRRIVPDFLLARAAPRDRGRRPPPRRPVRARRRQGAPAHPGGPRLPGGPGHLGAGDRPARRRRCGASGTPEHRERWIDRAEPDQSTARRWVVSFQSWMTCCLRS